MASWLVVYYRLRDSNLMIHRGVPIRVNQQDNRGHYITNPNNTQNSRANHLENIVYHFLGNWIAGFRGFKLMEINSNGCFPGTQNFP